MNTNSNDMSLRKSDHLNICLDHSKYPVESGNSHFQYVHFFHRALPEINADQIDMRTDVLGYKVRAPIFISCMTGGSDEGYKLNKELARAAEELQIPVGMGSNRILWKKPETLPHFNFRKFAPTVPILSNIGAVQIRDMDHNELIEMNKKLEVSAQVIHCNPGQELFQKEGDRDFSSLKDAIFRFIEKSPLPVIIKETGFGLHPDEARELLDKGAYAVDLAGSGGTNWIAVEAYRNTARELKRAKEFVEWGNPTALLLASLYDRPGIWASGGIRNGMDVAKALALGADLAGLAMSFIEAVKTGGKDSVIALFQDLEKTLKDVMLLTSSRNLSELQTTALRFDLEFEHAMRAYKAGSQRRTR